MQPAVVIPCHGGTSDPGLLDRNLAYFDLVAANARAALAEGGLPGDWQARQDLDALIALPFEDAVAAQGCDPATVSDFYRDAHRRAIRATLIGLTEGESE